MSMARMDKWIPGVSPDDRTSAVAGRTLRFRLAAVQHYLPLAAEKPDEDVEYVHELRVATRRTMAALRLYADMLPRRRTARMETLLKQIRRAADDARDYDVLAQRLSDGHSDAEARRFLEKVRSRRRKAQRPIQAVYRRLKKEDCFDRRVKKLLCGVRPRGKTKAEPKDPRFGEWARIHLRRIVKKFFKAAPTDDTDDPTLHRFRIRSKELRYEMELLAGAFPAEFVEELYPVVETLQQQLGEINDRATAQARVHQWIDTADDPSEADHLRTLLEDEHARLNGSRRTFLQWWTPQRKHDLQARFSELLAGRPEPATTCAGDRFRAVLPCT
jgi:CHAD domain-containing protein